MTERVPETGGDILVTGLGAIATPLGSCARTGTEMSRIRFVPDAAILVRNGIIDYAGPAGGTPRDLPRGVHVLDASGRLAVPGFVDSHTHFVFAGYRADEFLWRTKGVSYMEIHARGGGIRNSVRATREASLDRLVELGSMRLGAMLALGVTTVEGKSGYGLELGTELRQLEAMRILAERSPVDIVPTFMGPHATPPEFDGRPGEYIDHVVGEMLPAVARQGIAEYCDIFCEHGVFGIDDSRRYLAAAKALGFGIRIHADEIERLGGAGLAAELGAASADHLLKASAADLDRMAAAGVVATVLPLTAFSLGEPFADARGMIDRGLALALASDLNPGSCHSQSIPLVWALASLRLGLSPEETLTALTLNGAAALGRARRIGSLEPGKRGDIVLMDAPSLAHVPYSIGMNLVSAVVTAGTLVCGA